MSTRGVGVTQGSKCVCGEGGGRGVMDSIKSKQVGKG